VDEPRLPLLKSELLPSHSERSGRDTAISYELTVLGACAEKRLAFCRALIRHSRVVGWAISKSV
jgi:hypothetical protein